MTYHAMTILFSVDGEEASFIETVALDRHDAQSQLNEIYAGKVEIYSAIYRS